jgi:hypothetical protein
MGPQNGTGVDESARLPRDGVVNAVLHPVALPPRSRIRQRSRRRPRSRVPRAPHGLCLIAALAAGAALLLDARTVRADEADTRTEATRRRSAAPDADARLPRLSFRADVGFLAVLQHDFQQGQPGSRFDYRDEGGQDVLFPVSRYALGVDFAARHRVSLVYQPLELRTRERLRRDILVDGTTYAAGTDLDFVYGFPFYRASYEYAVWQTPGTRVGLGGGLQIRNATIEFSQTDGSNLVARRNVGPVPLLHASLRHDLGEPYWLEADADGIYAPIKYLNGNDNGVEGAILDANLRAGFDAGEHVAAFLNLRYLAGGAEGADDEDGLDDYTSNWLQFFILSVGVELR